MKRELEEGYELDDDPDRIDVDAVHAYLTRSYWAKGWRTSPTSTCYPSTAAEGSVPSSSAR